jgi:hypothetical protein
MPLAAILGMYLLSWLPAGTMPSVAAVTGRQSAQSQESQSDSSAPHDSSTQPPANQQKVPVQSAAPPSAAPPCPENSQPGSTGKSDCKPADSTAAKAKKRHRTQKNVPSAATPAQAGPSKTVVRNGGTEDPVVNLSLGPSPQASQQREKTKQLLAASDANLNKVSARQLTPSQQDTVKQIKSYMEQSSQARDEGDVQRAYNLALKANLLSVELVGH